MSRSLICSVLVALLGLPQLASSVNAQNVVDLWPSAPPAWQAPSEPERDTTKPDGRGVAGQRVVRLGNVSQPQLHTYPAKGSNTTIVICPGGGYHILAWDLEGTEIAKWFQAHGVSAAVLKYRVPNPNKETRWVAPVQDVQRSLAIVRGGAVDDLPNQHVGLLGFSAGGHATLMTATATKRHYDRIDDHDDQLLRPDFAALIYPGYLTKDKKSTELSTDFTITKDTPPMFFAHAFDDGHSCMGSIGVFSELKRLGVYPHPCMSSRLEVTASVDGTPKKRKMLGFRFAKRG